MAKVYFGFDDLIGSTPMVKLSRLSSALWLECEIYAKLECANPAGSSKDRAVKYMLDDAMKKGLITKGSMVVVPTSGNTGIALAAMSAVRGYNAVIVMPKGLSSERAKLIGGYGAKVVFTDSECGMAGAVAMAEEIVKNNPGAVMLSQFEDPANAEAHFATTGPEIFDSMDGDVDIFVAGVGTGGTISGVGRYLKMMRPSVKIVAVEPAESSVLLGGEANAHGIQGIGAGFVPQIYDEKLVDEVVAVSTEDAYDAARELARREGLLVGISSGAALSAAVTIALRRENHGKKIVVLLPDGGERYLSGDLFG